MSPFTGHIPIDQKTLIAVATVTAFPYALPKSTATFAQVMQCPGLAHNHFSISFYVV
jgi:hypothetical protein